MADPEIWKALIETGNPYVQQERQQKGLMGMMLLQEKQREMEDTQKLRDLYSSGQPVNPNQVMAINPKLGIEMQQAGNQAFMQQLQAEDMMRKKEEYESKVYAQHMAPVAQAYHDAVKAGTDPKVAESQFRWAVGDAQKNIQERFGITPKADFTKFSPQEIATRSHMLGVDVPWIKEIQEEEQSRRAVQQKQMPSFSDRYFTGPDGLLHPNPYFQQGGGGQQPEVQSKIQPYPVFKFDGKTYQGLEFMRMAIREKDPAKKQRMEEIMDSGFQQQQEGTLTDPNAVEMPKTKQQLEVEAAREKKQAELEVEGAHEAEQQLTTLKALNEQNVESLIDKSFHSKPEALAKGEYGLSGMAGMPTEANTAYKDLVVIEAQMRDMAKAIVGAGPISEGEQKIIKDALGGVSTPGDATSRKSAYRQFVKLAKTKIARYPHLAQQMKAIDEMSSKQSAAPSSQPSGASLKIGDIDEGMEYLGGDPNSQSSWKKVK